MKPFGVVIEGKQLVCFYVTDNDTANKAVAALTKKKSKIYGLDLETAKAEGYEKDPDAGLCPYRSTIRLCQVYDGDERIYIFDLWKVDLELLKKFLETHRFCAHNAMFDIMHLAHKGVWVKNCDCTIMLANLVHHVRDRTGSHLRAGLANLVAKEFKVNLSKEFQTSNWNAPELSFDQLQYAGLDTYYTVELAKKYIPKIVKWKMKKLYALNKKAQTAVVAMRLSGMRMHRKAHRDLIYRWEQIRYECAIEIDEIMPGVNTRSVKQMTEWLEKHVDFKELEKWPKTASGQYYKTDVDTIMDFAHLDFVRPLAEYKYYDKLCTTYGRFLYDKVNPITKRIHGGYTLCQTHTGRLSSRDPNCQNYPRTSEKTGDFRSLFIAEKDCVLLCADYSQIELRVAAEISKDPIMRKAYAAGKDLHTLMAAAITGRKMSEVGKEDRRMAKACFSGDTEILTRSGWVRFDEYDGVSSVAQYAVPAGVEINPGRRSASRFTPSYKNLLFSGVGGEITFVEPVDFRKFEDQKVFSHEDRNTSFIATGNHDILYTSSNGILRKTPFEDVKDVRHFIGAGYYRQSSRKHRLNPRMTRLLAATVADGSFQGSNTIRFGFTKTRKAKRLVKLIKDCDLNHTYRTKDRVISITIKNPDLVELFLNYTTRNKDLNWHCLDSIDIRAYIEEAALWDSHVLDKGDDRVLFSSTSKQTVDVMQAMCCVTGLRSVSKSVSEPKGNAKRVYQLSYSLAESPLHRVSFKREPAGTADVYCVQVPEGNIVIRHNGKVSVQGNCNFGLLFGMGAAKLSLYARVNYGVDMTVEQAKEYVAMFHELYSGYAKWKTKQTKKCEESLLVRTPFGKLRRLTEKGYYSTGLNTPVQGGASEVMIHALIGLHEAYERELPGDARIVNCVHDELLVEVTRKKEIVERAAKLMKQEMVGAMKTVFPKAPVRDLVEVGLGTSWSSAKT